MTAARRVFLAAALALATMGVSMHIGGRAEHRAETVALQAAILRGEPGTLDGRPIYFPRIYVPAVTLALMAGADTEGSAPRV